MNRISVIVCNRNDSRFLINCIDKIKKQHPIEIIVVDDFSTDRSLDLLNEIKGVRVINNKNRGVFNALMTGVSEAKGEFISMISCDDEPLCGYLDSMEKAINKYDLVDLFTCNCIVEKDGRTYERTLFPFDAFISPDYAKKILDGGYGRFINMAGIVVRKQKILDTFLCPRETKENFDAVLNLSCMSEKGFMNIGKHLFLFRSYSNSFGIKSMGFTLRNTLIYILSILPKFARHYVYKCYYKYDNRIEKL